MRLARETRQGLDSPSSWKEVRMSFQKFKKYDYKAGDLTNSSMLSLSDAAIPDAVDNFKGIIESSQQAISIPHDNGSRK